MAKRGQTQPWRMTFVWPATDDRPEGATATRAFGSREDAEAAAVRQAATTNGVTGLANCTAQVTHRDAPTRVLSTHQGPDAASASR